MTSDNQMESAKRLFREVGQASAMELGFRSRKAPWLTREQFLVSVAIEGMRSAFKLAEVNATLIRRLCEYLLAVSDMAISGVTEPLDALFSAMDVANA